MGAGEDMVRYVCGGWRRHGEGGMYVGAGKDMVRYVFGDRRRHGEVCMWGQEKTW